jgi:hypothetical protein
MTLFEYMSVALSVVLSLSAAQILSNIRSVFDPARRDWVHGLWMLHVLVLHVVIWWSGWAFRDASWNLGYFSLVLSAPGLLFVASNALVPSDQSVSLRELFIARRRLFFAARGLLVLVSFAATHLLLGIPLVAPERLVGLLILAICVVGFASPSYRVQICIAILALLVEVGVVGYLRLEPGSLTGG